MAQPKRRGPSRRGSSSSSTRTPRANAAPASDESPHTVGVSGVYIQQAAAMVGTTSASLRMWEKYELIKPQRTPSGYRVYSLEEIERLREVQQLLHDGVNPAGILKIFEDRSSTPTPAPKHHEEGHLPRGLGDTVRALRRRSGLTLRQVSERTDLSPSYISSVERSLASPSIASLQKLARAFDTTVPALMSGSYEAPDSPLVRIGDRRVLHSDKGVTIEDMSTAGSNLEPLLFTVQPGAGSDGPLSHEGEEFLYVMSGELVLRLDGTDDFVLAPGDSMAYESPRPHQFSNVGRVPTVVLWINTPRTF
jgi:DNA-binding transcriptional MerR regulator/mannose-6-phosphate isomerase-like protein (cupin superfamily)